MWNNTNNGGKKVGNGLVAVAIDKDKSSQYALKWAIDNLLTRGKTAILIHVFNKASSFSASLGINGEIDSMSKMDMESTSRELFLSFHCYCTRKDVRCLDIVLHDNDVAKAVSDYVTYNAIDNLVVGASTNHGFMRKFKADLPGIISRGAPDFCTVYIISKGKISYKRTASRTASFASPLLEQIETLSNSDSHSDTTSMRSKSMRDRTPVKPRMSVDDLKAFKGNGKQFPDVLGPEMDVSFISSGRPSASSDLSSSLNLDYIDPIHTPRISTSSATSLGATRYQDLSYVSPDSPRTSCSISSFGMHEDLDSEMRRLKLELKQTMELYSTACKEAISAKQKAMELARLKQEQQRSQEPSETAASTTTTLSGTEDTLTLSAHGISYRRYTIMEIEEATENFTPSRKIGEGGYGPVFKCHLDHTPVAVKVLRPDAAQGRTQFLREIEVLSLIRHPNMVLLLGACPEYGILVYEYMAKGSLEDRLFRRGNTPVLSWRLRFKIAAEIATGLLFLHQTKPEPLVHRDLKPANILLDSYYVSKISDVGLARLVPVVADNVTQCHMTSTAGTFCYIDPEYQQTGMLGVKSDVYSLGIILLQLITGRPPMGLAHQVGHAIENGRFKEMLDAAVSDWPEEEALRLAKIGIQCAELRRKDRPDLSKGVLPELNRLRELAEEGSNHFFFFGSCGPSPDHSYTSYSQEIPKSQSSAVSQVEEEAEQ